MQLYGWIRWLVTSDEALNWPIDGNPQRMRLHKVKVEHLAFTKVDSADCDVIIIACMKGIPY